MSFALVCGTGRGQTHRDLVDGGFEQFAGCALSVHRQLCAKDFDQVGAGERRLIDLLGRGQDARSVEAGAR
jgi:hypothetical protein